MAGSGTAHLRDTDDEPFDAKDDVVLIPQVRGTTAGHQATPAVAVTVLSKGVPAAVRPAARLRASAS